MAGGLTVRPGAGLRFQDCSARCLKSQEERARRKAAEADAKRKAAAEAEAKRKAEEKAGSGLSPKPLAVVFSVRPPVVRECQEISCPTTSEMH